MHILVQAHGQDKFYNIVCGIILKGIFLAFFQAQLQIFLINIDITLALQKVWHIFLQFLPKIFCSITCSRDSESQFGFQPFWNTEEETGKSDAELGYFVMDR